MKKLFIALILSTLMPTMYGMEKSQTPHPMIEAINNDNMLLLRRTSLIKNGEIAVKDAYYLSYDFIDSHAFELGKPDDIHATFDPSQPFSIKEIESSMHIGSAYLNKNSESSPATNSIEAIAYFIVHIRESEKNQPKWAQEWTIANWLAQNRNNKTFQTNLAHSQSHIGNNAISDKEYALGLLGILNKSKLVGAK